MKMKQKKQAGQTLLEFAFLFVVLVLAFLAMQKFLQRSVQGKWKDSLQGMAKPYDPAGNHEEVFSMSSNAQTLINIIEDSEGNYHTWRTDTTNMIEDKTESTRFQGL